MDKEKNRNEVAIILDKELQKGVVDMQWKSDRILHINIVLESLLTMC